MICPRCGNPRNLPEPKNEDTFMDCTCGYIGTSGDFVEAAWASKYLGVDIPSFWRECNPDD